MTYKDPDKQREAVKAATRRYRGKGGDSALSSPKEVSQNERGLPVVDQVGDTQPVIPKCPHKLNSMANIINEQVLGKLKRDRYKGMTHNVTERMYEAHKKREGMTVKNERSNVIPSEKGIKALAMAASLLPDVIPKPKRPSVMMDEQGVTNGAKIHLLEQGKDTAIMEKSRQTGMTDSVSAHIDKALPDKLVGAMLSGDVALADKCADEILGKRGKDIKCFADLPADVQQTINSLSMVDGKICKRVKANRTAIAINYQHLFPDRFHSTGVAV